MSKKIDELLGINESMKSSKSTTNKELNYSQSGILKIIAAISIVAIIFFPVAGCGGENATGLDIIKAKESQLPHGIKLFVIISIMSGCVIFFLKDNLHMIISSITGIVTLLISYLIAKDKLGGYLDLKIGAYLGILGYGAIALLSYLKISGKNNSEMLTKSVFNPSKNENTKTIFSDSIQQLEKLNELKLKGIISEEEFLKKKAELLDKI